MDLQVMQPNLWGDGRPRVGSALAPPTGLDATSWVSVTPAWLYGAQTLFDELHRNLDWRAGRRPMYDRVVDVPRLTATVRPSDRSAAVADIVAALESHFDCSFGPIGANLYRDGRDSVAWHGDRIGRHRASSIVALLSVGAPRRLLLRPRGGGRARTFPLHSGDLLVMGGACQLDWEHCVPKERISGPRISLAFRAGLSARWQHQPQKQLLPE